MHIQASPRVHTPKPTQAGSPAAKKDDNFWRDFGNDVREFMLYFDHEKIADAGRLMKDIGQALKDSYKVVRDLPERIFGLPVIRDHVDQDSRQFWTDLGETAGIAAGFTAAGGHALSGCLKIASGFKQGSTSRKLDGLVDIATATSLAVAVAGLSAARLVVAPIASTINIVRGAFNVAVGYRQHDKRKQLQGALDISRSIGSIGRIFRSKNPVMKGIGIAMAPVAGALQAGRGIHDIGTGLKNDDKKKIVRGLADVATAVGTALAFASGVAVIPGVALAVAANVLKVGYQFSPRFRKKVDAGLDKLRPKLQKFVDKAEAIGAPVERIWKKLLGKIIKGQDAPAPERFSKGQLAAVTGLMHVDGEYSREENRRIRTAMEERGQRKEIPKLDKPGPSMLGVGQELNRDLPTPEARKDFVQFLLVVADYDYDISADEVEFVRGLSRDLEVPAADFDALVTAQRSRSREKALKSA